MAAEQRIEQLSDMLRLSTWSAAHVAAIDPLHYPAMPLITADDAAPAFPGLDVWDMWPLQHVDGRTAILGGAELWFLLSAPQFADPVQRHDHARIRLASFANGRWQDCGPALPDGFAPGSREWAGSAVLRDGGQVTLYFTAAGERGAPGGFAQRLFQTHGQLVQQGGTFCIDGWSGLTESVMADGDTYVIVRADTGVPGAIKGFRDPAFFRDPADGRDYLLFTGSAGWDDHPHNGVIGLAAAEDREQDARGPQRWTLCPPLLSAVGVNNELERPHIVVRGGLYYLFWSTQRHTFAPTGPTGPNGLYAMVADRLTGDWRPVNGSGLVIGNPPGEPYQAYSWWVTGEGDVAGFIDLWGLGGRSAADDAVLRRERFGGTPAPRLSVKFDGETVTLRA